MRVNLLFLGTGAGIPAKLRNVTSVALKLLEERNAVWLFDCGEATQHQILHTSLKPRKIEKIFITHLHGDHIYGLPGLLGSRSFQGGESELTVYGPAGIRKYIEVSLQVSDTHVKYPLRIVEIEPGIIFEDEQFTVEALPLDHGVLSFGYRICEKDRPGALDADKLHAAGVPPGPMYRLLKEGKDVTLADGRLLHGPDFLGPDQKGRVLAILGDTRPCGNSSLLGENADVMVHEATFASGNEQMASDYFHSTTVQAAKAARDANASRLILTHISSRYSKEDWRGLEVEAREIFPDTLIASDFLEVDIPPHK